VKLKEAVREYRPQFKYEAVVGAAGAIASEVYFSVTHWIRHEQTNHAALHHEFEMLKSMGYGFAAAAGFVAASRLLASIYKSAENVNGAGGHQNHSDESYQSLDTHQRLGEV
jgi:hypothetical protein